MPFGFLDLGKVMKCSTIRKQQLQKEEQLDHRLVQCEDKIVKDYVLAYRAFNRSLASTLYATSLLQTPALLLQQLEVIEQHLNKMETVPNLCNDLPVLIKDLTYPPPP